jgi:hypothetical protein
VFAPVFDVSLDELFFVSFGREPGGESSQRIATIIMLIYAGRAARQSNRSGAGSV